MKQLPIAICVMSRRRKTDYVAVYQEFCDILPLRQVKRIALDFEGATDNLCELYFLLYSSKDVHSILHKRYGGTLGSAVSK